jgi:hypothetical protein
MLRDAQRALVALHTPASGPPSRDFVTYWRGFAAGDESSKLYARFVRISAAVHSSAEGITRR